MSYVFYKVMHLTGIMMTMTALGAAILQTMNSGENRFPHKKLVGLLHGFGLLLALVGGFGLIARLGLDFHGWLWLKSLIWLILGAIITLIYKKRQWGLPLWLGLIAIGGFAAWLANTKPF
ncbi:MAG: hypothetical protein N838_13990 [Thiohalocapsa sp. PB-PSB1]|jgi:hypothetical protein|nr:MAG: hypothetical protein N838_13990 [Thiohalocapsa sp. PB-PSB1]